LCTRPDGAGSPTSKAFSDTPRRISFSLNTSIAARQRSSVSAWIVTASSPVQLTRAPVPRKSNRVSSSFVAWFSALSTSCLSTLLTQSNDESATCVPPPRSHAVARLPNRLEPTPGRCVSFPLAAGATGQPAAGCPSGQRERSVKPSVIAYVGSNPTPATLL